MLVFAQLSMANDWQMVGKAKLKVLFWSVYESSLYTNTGSYEQNQLPVRLDIRYLRDIEAKELIKQTEKEWQHLAVEEQLYQTWLPLLEELWPDVKKDDVLSLHIDSDQTATFLWNDETLGQIDDKKFGQNFLAIWVSPDCSRPKHREKLLALEKR